MNKKEILIFCFCVIFIFVNKISYSQTGEIQGVVKDENKEPVPFASVVLELDSNMVAGAPTDFDGYYILKPVPAGIYTVKVNCVGFHTQTITGVLVNAGKVRFLDIEIKSKNVKLKEVCVVAYKVPLFDKDNTQSGETVTSDQIRKMSGRGVNSVDATYNGVYSEDGKVGSIRGGRADANITIIDGMQIQGSSKIPYHIENTEEYDEIVENEFVNPLDKPLSTFSIDVDKASYSNIRRFLNSGQLPPADAVRIEEMINYFDYDYPEPKGKEPFAVQTHIGACDWNKKHQLMMVNLQAKTIEKENLPASNLTFLLDVSGSMSYSLNLVKKSMRLLVNQLSERDKIAIVVYAGASGLVLEPTSCDKKQTILNALDNLQAGGSTAGGAGIELAYKTAMENFIKNGNNRIILATDGDFNVGISNDDALVKLIEEKRKSGVFLSVLGFGSGNYKDSKMEKLADHGNGNYAYIDNLMEAQKVLVTEMGGTLVTIAKDVKIQIEFNPENVISYKLIGYENRILADKDFNDDTKDAGELGVGHNVTAFYEIIPNGVKSKFLQEREVNDLKYQETNFQKGFSNELATIKLRYKNPKEDKSKLIQTTIKTVSKENYTENVDFHFASAVIEFGMLLRNSYFKNKSSFKKVIKLAKANKGEDKEGYRVEFIKLVNLAKNLK